MGTPALFTRNRASRPKFAGTTATVQPSAPQRPNNPDWVVVLVLEKVHAVLIALAISIAVVPAFILVSSGGASATRPVITETVTSTMNQTIVITQTYLNPNPIILNSTNVLVGVNQTIPVNFKLLHNFTRYAMFYTVHDQRGTQLNLPLTWILMGGASGVIRGSGSVDMTALLHKTGDYTVTFQNSTKQPFYVDLMIVGT